MNPSKFSNAKAVCVRLFVCVFLCVGAVDKSLVLVELLKQQLSQEIVCIAKSANNPSL